MRPPPAPLRQAVRAALQAPAASWRGPVLGVLLLAMLLLSSPWAGLDGDAKLYAVQALRRLYPANFQNDLYFLFGSQDAFTIFSPLYAACIAWLGVTGAALLLLVLGNLLWLGAAAWLLAPFLRGYHFWQGLVLLLLLPSDYGPLPLGFGLREALLTPRLYGEACAMLALACGVRGQWWRGAAALLLALLLHPLMALGAALAGWFLLAHSHARAALLAGLAGLVLLAGGALLELAPFNRILHSMDPAWLASVHANAPMVLWDAWRPAEWLGRTATAFALLLVAGALAPGAPGRLLRCLAGAGACGLLASWLGSGVFHNVLLIQVQPWRMLWLVQLGSAIALAWLLAAYWQRGRMFRLLLLALVVAVLTRNSIGAPLAALAGFWLVRQARSAAPLALEHARYRLWAALVLALASLWLAELAGKALSSGALVAAALGESALALWARAAHVTGASALLGMAALALAWRWTAAGDGRRHARWLAAGLAGGALGLAAWAGWQQARSEPRMSAQAERAVQAVFAPLIPATATVYWENDVRASWFVLQRASYAARGQLSGVAFNRGTALEGPRRLARLEQLGVADSIRAHRREDGERRLARLPRTSIAGLAFVCQDPALHFVVLSQPLGDSIIAKVHDAAFGTTYYLHDCARLRGGAAAN